MNNTSKTQTSGTQREAIHATHLALAEAGKVHALRGQHSEALRHYREAIKTAVFAGSPEIFFRHYTQCVLESLELSGSYTEVIDFCKNADAHYETLEFSTPIIRRDHANTLERWGVALLKSGQQDEASGILRRAKEQAMPSAMPVAERLLGWLERRLVPDTKHILEVQKQYNYFTVRKNQVDANRARFLPEKHQHSAPSAFAFNP